MDRDKTVTYIFSFRKSVSEGETAKARERLLCKERSERNGESGHWTDTRISSK